MIQRQFLHDTSKLLVSYSPYCFCGFNNDPISKVVEPNLTTVNYSGYNVGEVAVMNLINHLKGLSSTKATNIIVLRADLVVRESSLKNKSL
jgi:LacI family transcriptional regulator